MYTSQLVLTFVKVYFIKSQALTWMHGEAPLLSADALQHWAVTLCAKTNSQKTRRLQNRNITSSLKLSSANSYVLLSGIRWPEASSFSAVELWKQNKQ